MKPFHQIARYETVRKAIESMRWQKQHTILEVGSGSHGNLAIYLPNDKITFLDTVLTEEAQNDPRFVIGDATKLSYPDGSFDFVIGSDVLEHIIPQKRNDFLNEVSRVAKYGVFLSFPQKEYGNTGADETLRATYIAAQSKPPIWIDEHIDCILPNANEIEKMLGSIVGEKHIFRAHSIRRSLMQKMLSLEAISSHYANVEKYFEVINEQYISDILPNDILCDEYCSSKCLFLIDFKRTTEKIQQRFTSDLQSNQEIINIFEAALESRIGWFMQLEGLTSENWTHEAITRNQKQLLDNFEVLNGRTQATLGALIESERANQKELLQNFEVLNGRAQVNFGAITEEIHQVKTILQRIADDNYVVDIVLITYNQSKYIEETVKSILNQKTRFRFRVLVADDCSTDDTVEKIKRMSKDTDIPFEFLYSDHNLGIMKNYQRSFQACTAEFTAILEGDDIWIDPLRLQKHVDFLQQHAECSMSFNRYIVKNFETGIFYSQPRFSAEDEKKPFRYISGHDLAYDNLIGNFSTAVYRTACLHALPEQLFVMKAYDWLTNILISKMGYIGCLMGTSSVYRIHSNGVWSGQSREKQLTGLLTTIDEYNQYTNYEFNEGFTAHRNRVLAELKALEVEEKVETVLPEKTLKSGKQYVKICARKAFSAKKYLPPIIVTVIRLLVPTVIQDKIKQKCGIGR